MTLLTFFVVYMFTCILWETSILIIWIQNKTGYNNLEWFEHRSRLEPKMKNITCYSNNNSCLDPVYTNSKITSKSGTLDCNISDHQSVFITCKHITKPKEKLEFSGRSYLNLDEELFCTKFPMMTGICFSPLLMLMMLGIMFFKKLRQILKNYAL